MTLKLVPFNPIWASHNKLDLHAIYRRPRYREDEYGERVSIEENGLPAWDLTGPLPVRQHHKWAAKGFEYVTLADVDSLVAAAEKRTIAGNWREYSQDPKTGGPWNYRKYVEGQAVIVTDELAKLRADVAKFGSQAVEELRGIELPTWLKGFKPGDSVPTEPPTLAKAG